MAEEDSPSAAPMDVDQQDVDESADDEIVREIDVYINRLPDAELYLLQYPLRPVYRPYGDQGQLATVDIKKTQRRLRLSYLMNTESDNYDKDNPIHAVARHHLVSKPGSSSTDSSYAIGILRGGSLTVSPLSAVCQFRPSFAHVDKAAEDAILPDEAQEPQPEETAGSSRKKRVKQEEGAGAAAAAASASGGAKAEASDVKEEKEEKPLVSVSYRRRESVSEQQALALSQARQREMEEAEPWQDIYFYDCDTGECAEMFDNLCKLADDGQAYHRQLLMRGLRQHQHQQEPPKKQQKKPPGGKSRRGSRDVSMVEVEYVEEDLTLSDGDEQLEDEDTDLKPPPEVAFLPAVEPYLNALCACGEGGAPGGTSAAAAGQADAASGPISFLSLSRLTIDQQVQKVLTHLQVVTFARMKQLLTRSVDDPQLLSFLEEFGTVVMGNWVAKSTLVCRDPYEALCRDLLLTLLRQGGAGVQRGKFQEAVKMDSERVSEMLSAVGEFRMQHWQFKLPPDDAFKQAFPDVCDRFDKRWNEGRQKLVEEIQKKQRQRDATHHRRSKVHLQQTVETILRDGGAQALAEIKAAVHAKHDAKGTVTTDADIQEVLPAIAIELKGIWALQSRKDPQVDPYRDVLISLFRRQDHITKSEVTQEFQTLMNRKFELADFTFRSLLREFAENDRGIWKFKGSIKKAQAAGKGISAMSPILRLKDSPIQAPIKRSLSPPFPPAFAPKVPPPRNKPGQSQSLSPTASKRASVNGHVVVDIDQLEELPPAQQQVDAEAGLEGDGKKKAKKGSEKG